MSNTSTVDKWFRIGKFCSPKASQQWALEMISKLSSANPLQTVSSGVTYLNLQRCTIAVYANMFHRGLTAVVDVKYKPVYTDIVELWVKLKARSGDTMFNLRSTGPTRFESGSCSCSLFSPDLSEVNDETTIGTYTPSARLSLPNDVA